MMFIALKRETIEAVHYVSTPASGHHLSASQCRLPLLG